MPGNAKIEKNVENAEYVRTDGNVNIIVAIKMKIVATGNLKFYMIILEQANMSSCWFIWCI